MRRELVNRILATYPAMAQDDLDPALALVTEDFVIDESLILPDGGKYFGREGFVAFAAEVRDRWRELDFGIDEVHDLGEAIVVEAHVDLRGRLTDATARQRVRSRVRTRGREGEAARYLSDAR